MGELSSIKGIGPKIEKYFANLGINSTNDLLYFFPRDYEEYDEPKQIIDLEAGKMATIYAMVQTKPSIFRKGRTTITSCWLDDGTAKIRAYWFNITFINKSITLGQSFIFRGKVSRVKTGIAISQCKVFKKETYETFRGNLSPIYSLTKGLTNNTIKKAIKNLLEDDKEEELCNEYLPKDILEERNLCDLSYAFNHIHFPEKMDDMQVARKRLVYDEFFLFSLAMFINKDKAVKIGREEFKNVDKKYLDAFIKKLPFKLTDGQFKILDDILKDFKSGNKMSRLIEGDVGSGKTILAILSAVITSKLGLQTGFMAPTEILAEQHYNSIVGLFKSVGSNEKLVVASPIYEGEFTVALLTGSTKARDRKIILEKLKDGNIDILIGTHSLFSDDVIYKDLALCIIDEQHRFGVNQRRAFEEKSNNANVLLMSATPIPRTLAMLIYGDMDISRLTEKPQNRIPVKNYVANTKEREKAYRSMKKQIDMGHQAYVICPAIEREDEEEVGSFANYQNVYDYAKNLSEFYGKSIKIEVLHGKMKPNEKYDVMQKFKNGEIQILVSTTVVEVGVDVPNATFIMIEDANAFGLAELHQLRGRVGRGKAQSYALFVDTNPSEKSEKRLRVLMDSNDGFYIAEEDLKLRGPGDIFGVKQSGEMDFKLADMYTDIGLFRNASVDAKEFINKNSTMPKRLRVKLDEYLKLGLVI